jgi:NAD(P)-dependent dehydrogenase (short-subunit alcohol dehydrogenase family)
MNQKNSKIALVTGGNRGIGLAIAQGLQAKGYRLIVTARSLDKAQAAAEKLGATTIPLELDISNDRSIEEAAATLKQNIERLDVLVNNAGIYPDSSVDILTTTRDLLDLGMNTNALGTILTVQALLPLLEKSQDARVINISSGMGALDALTTTAPSYCLSKLALNGATIMLAQSLESKGIVVNAVCPGWVKTDMGGTSAPRSPQEGADTAIWLATEASRDESGKFWRDRHLISY